MKIENRKYRDTVFRMLYKDKRNLLELYNAINGTSYKNPDDLEVKTLDGSTLLNMRNDASFIFDDELNLYEHQGSLCPNIPLRMLLYLAASLRKEIPLEDTYREKPIEIPVPRFVVFYNGSDPMPDKATYRLSDIFKKETPNPEIELYVKVFNINEGHNSSLMETAKTLREYSIFVEKVRKYRKKDSHKLLMTKSTDSANAMHNQEIIRLAVTAAIDECIRENILKDFFTAHREEAIKVGTLEQDFQLIIDANKEGYEEMLAEKDAAIADIKKKMNSAITEKDSAIAEKDADIARLKELLDAANIKY